MIEKLIAGTELRAVEYLARRVTHAQLKFEPGHRGDATWRLVRKGAGELWAFAACMRVGNLWGAWHHWRTMLELRANAHHLFGSEEREDHRLLQLASWRHAAPWVSWQRTRLDFAKSDKGEAAKRAVYVRTYPNPPPSVNATEDQIAEWAELFGLGDTREKRLAQFKKAKAKAWHSPVPLQDLIDALGPEVALQYDLACQASHFSPLGDGLVYPNESPSVLGWDPKQGIMCVQFMLRDSQAFLQRIGFPDDPVGIAALERAAAACDEIRDADENFPNEQEYEV